MAVIAQPFSPAAGQLRPFDVLRDLNAVADLVELCFADTLDPDGERYLRQMRDAARSASFLRWASSVSDQASLPLSGYVWEEDARIVGNLSLIPFRYDRKRYFLIANVAVHPDYRRRGIARALTSTAMQHALLRKAAGTWLHVRDNNEAAVNLYLSLGFRERARRTTWHSITQSQGIVLPDGDLARSGFSIGSRRNIHWPQQREWLNALYPPLLTWHLPVNLGNMVPGIRGIVGSLLAGTQQRHFVATRGDRLLATVTWQSGQAYSDYLWLAVPPIVDHSAIQALLSYTRTHLPPRHPLTLDFPAGVAIPPIQAAGFSTHQTLIWMEVSFDR
jgi:ribosomal protein S18 acetylase RimI-like enzyme